MAHRFAVHKATPALSTSSNCIDEGLVGNNSEFHSWHGAARLPSVPLPDLLPDLGVVVVVVGGALFFVYGTGQYD